MIRRLEPRDAELLKELRLGALADAPRAFRTTYAQAAARTDADWRGLLAPDAHPTFVWQDGDDVHGMVVAMRAPAESGSGSTSGSQSTSMSLVAMWVRPSARGTGVADALVERVLTWAREQGVRRVELEVAAGNERAERLYARHGFTRREERRATDSVCEIEMEIEL